MRTLLVTENFPPRVGGSAKWLWETFSRFPESRVAVVAGECAGAEAFDKNHAMTIARIPFDFRSWGILGARSAAQYLKLYVAIRRIARREKVGAVAAARLLPEGLIALALHRTEGLPFSCFVYGEEIAYGASSRELSFLMRRVLAKTQNLVSCGGHTVRRLIEDWNVPEEKLHLLYPGVDTGKYVPSPRDLAVRAELGWGIRPVILTVGRLQRRKGQDMMIRALPEIRRRVSDILYTIAGNGEERGNLESLAQELGVRESVQFLEGATDDFLLRCYQQCDIFALPNRQDGHDIEGFGIVLLEAQACGKPVIAGTSGGTAETMNIPHTGIAIDCTSPNRLADTVINWLKDPAGRETMGRAAREWVVGNFDWSAVDEKARRIFGIDAQPQIPPSVRQQLPAMIE